MEGGTVSSLKKSLDVLNCFIEEPRLGVTQISRKLGISKGHIFKILATYESMGYLSKDPESGKYELGVRMFALSRAMGEKFAVTKVAAPYLQELANQFNQRVYLAMPYEDQVLYLDAFYPIGEISLLRNILGERAEMYCTGLGKAMLSAMAPDTVSAYCEGREFVQYTDRTITTKEDLKEELSRIQRRGYAIDDMEHEFGIRCVAMPLYDRSSRLEGAVSISGSSVSFQGDYMLSLAQQLKKTVRDVEARL